MTPATTPSEAAHMLDGFFGRPGAPGAVDWRSCFEGQVLTLAVEASGARVVKVTFADGVAQVAPPCPFDAHACAKALAVAARAIGEAT